MALSEPDGSGAVRLEVCPTAQRDFEKEYIAQLSRESLETNFPDTAEREFLAIRSMEPIETEIHARVMVNEEIPSGSIGLDFTLRTALGAPSALEREHGDADSEATVSVYGISNAETSAGRRLLNRALGVRPQVCRVRMGVFPDLEDKVCRLPHNTMDMLGIEDGENVTIESTRGERIVHGVKAFEIDDERDETKEQQKNRDEDRYPRCQNMLGLDRIRRTEVDVPELWIDQETRSNLGLTDLPKSGVCQPVRVYRDSRYLFEQKLHQFAVPLVVVLFATGLELQDLGITALLWTGAVLLWFGVILIASRSRLS